MFDNVTIWHCAMDRQHTARRMRRLQSRESCEAVRTCCCCRRCSCRIIVIAVMISSSSSSPSPPPPTSPQSPVMQQHIIKHNAQQPRTRPLRRCRQRVHAAAPTHRIHDSRNRLDILIPPLLRHIIHHPRLAYTHEKINCININQRCPAAEHEARRRCRCLPPRHAIRLLGSVHVTHASAARQDLLEFRARQRWRTARHDHHQTEGGSVA